MQRCILGVLALQFYGIDVVANQITDNRTSINVADSATGYVDLSGAAAGTLDTEIFYEGTASAGQYVTSTIDGLLYDYTTATDLSNNVFYFLINCGIVGLLDTKTNGGFRIRFTGATVTDWFEVYVAGSDSWPASFSGGWTLFVVDIEDARSTAVTNGWTNGTTPATTAIQRVGYAAITGGTMPRMVDNTWMDAMYRLADGNPAIIVEGRNAGTTDWDWDDVVTEMVTAESPVARYSDGGAITLSGPVQFGINDTSTHAFTATNKVILWDNQEYAPSDLYGFSALGNSGGTTNITMGVKTGTGDDATGAQGCTISAASTGARWAMDFDDANVDGVNLYGCNFIHGGAFLLNDPAVSVISSFYIDCSSALVSNSEQLRISVVNANTADGVAFMTTDDIGDIVYSSFQFSDGHAIELTTPRVASQTSKGNLFAGYGTTTSNDAAVYNNTAGAVTITVTASGDSPTYRDGTSASTTIIAGAVTVQATAALKDGTPVENARVFLKASDNTGPFPFEETVTSITRSTTTATVTHTAHGLATNDKIYLEGITDKTEDNWRIIQVTVTGANTYTFTTTDSGSTNYTGTIKCTFVALNGLTNASGILSTSRVYSTDQPVVGWTRKSTSSPLLSEGVLVGSVDSASGFSGTAVMLADE